MSQVLRSHMSDFGFTHSEIARRSARLNAATAYRVVEGDTANPSLKSVTGIVEAAALTDADAGVLYRRLAGHQAQPKRHVHPEGVRTHADAARMTKDALDQGRIRDAAYGVMSMFELAADAAERADAYEQAGIVYMGLGRWDEAQANLEAADALVVGNIDDPDLAAPVLNRKLTLMTNIGSLMAKRGNASWALLFGRTVAQHPRATPNNRGWGLLVMGEAALALNDPGAVGHLERALATFTACADTQDPRARTQAEGNVRWSLLHVRYAQARFMGASAEALADLEAEWSDLDPEASAMAGLFHALCLESVRRRQLKLRDLRARARRHGLGEIAQRASAALALALMLLGLGIPAMQGLDAGVAEVPTHERGNTGGKST
jgi:tetratricopeptide (TPR) repeat protein